MAMTKCKECGTEVSTKADKCPKCGAVRRRPAGCFGAIVATLFLLFSMSYLMQSCSGTRGTATAPLDEFAGMTPEQAAKVRAQREGTVWQYGSGTDTMTSKPMRWAFVKSSNLFEIDRPYEGAQRAELQLREHPRHGLDVMLSVERGQILCDMHDGCRYPIRFDEAAPEQWAFGEPTDHSSDVLFIRDAPAFLRKLRKAKTVTVEIQFYQSGPRALTFNTADLKWE